MRHPIRKISISNPTPERAQKAAGLGHRLVGRRAVQACKTTVELLEDRGHLPKHLRQALDVTCVAAVEAMNVSVVDEQKCSSARFVSGYGDDPLVAYGPRDISDRALNARYLFKCLEREIPEHLKGLFDRLVDEETGPMSARAPSLQRFGNSFGWNQDKQAGASGAQQVIDICGILHHAIKRGIGKLKTEKS